jgi:Ran GTPase-activating protein (RanGAP) involved in mRNA processing and transport
VLVQELDLSKNQLSSEGFADFTEALANWTELRILRLSVNKIGNQSLKELAQGLAGLSKLEELHVKLCIVGSVASEDPATWDGCLEIAVQAAKLPAFQKLDISDNRIPQSLAVLLMMQLAKAPALEELCVAGNTFDPRHWVLVPQEEIPMFPALRRLGASHCMGSSMLSEEMMIGQDSMISTVLTSLNLSGSQHLVSCLVGDFTVARLQILRHLDVSRTEIAVALLSSVLQQMPELQSLNISAVKAPAAGQGSLEDALRFLTQLTRLDAARAYRKTHQPILPMLSRLENLQHVNLSGRSEPGASLAGLSSLTYLCLAQGNLSGGCAEALATSLPEARPLRHLDISKAKCSFHGLCQILLVAAELPLEYLNISKAAGVRLVQAPIDTVVGASLSHCTRLCDLVWQSAPAGPLQTIGFQLTELTSLTHLDVQGANIGSSLETWDIAWLGLLSGTLRTLNLKNTGLFGASMGIIEAPWVRDRLDQHIIPTLGALTGLRSLNLGANPFSSMSDDSGCGLAKALAKLRSLTMLKLHKCNLSKPTFISVAQLAVPKLLLLKVLDLEGNPAADTDAMHALECGLVGILGLEKLYLSPGGLVCAKAASEDPENIVRRALGGRCDCISCDQSIDLH